MSRKNVFFGKVCLKHPNFLGERYRRGTCVRCDADKSREYARKHVDTGIGCAESTRMGYVCELLVAADLNTRCGRAYPNPEPQTKDDVYAKTSLGWRSVQCKKIKLNRKTGYAQSVTKSVMREITSDILAEVDFYGVRVRYRSLKGELPPELPASMERVCSKFVVFASQQEAKKCPYLSSNVPAAKRKSNSSLSTTKSRKTVPAAARSKKLSSVRQRPSASVATVKEE